MQQDLSRMGHPKQPQLNPSRSTRGICCLRPKTVLDFAVTYAMQVKEMGQREHTEEESLLTQTIPRSTSNLVKPQAQPLAIQLLAQERNSIIFTQPPAGRTLSCVLKFQLKLMWILFIGGLKTH